MIDATEPRGARTAEGCPIASGWGRLLAFSGYLVESVRRGHGGRGNNDISCDDAYPRYLVSKIDSNETPHKVEFVRSNKGFVQ